MLSIRNIYKYKNINRITLKGWKKKDYENTNQKKAVY